MFICLLKRNIYHTCIKWLIQKYWILCWCERSNWQANFSIFYLRIVQSQSMTSMFLFHLKHVRRVQERCAEQLCESRPLSMNYDTRDNNCRLIFVLQGVRWNVQWNVQRNVQWNVHWNVHQGPPVPVTPDGWILETGTLMNLLKLCPFIIIVLLRQCHLTTSFILQ